LGPSKVHFFFSSLSGKWPVMRNSELSLTPLPSVHLIVTKLSCLLFPLIRKARFFYILFFFPLSLPPPPLRKKFRQRGAALSFLFSFPPLTLEIQCPFPLPSSPPAEEMKELTFPPLRVFSFPPFMGRSIMCRKDYSLLLPLVDS